MKASPKVNAPPNLFPNFCTGSELSLQDCKIKPCLDNKSQGTRHLLNKRYTASYMQKLPFQKKMQKLAFVD